MLPGMIATSWLRACADFVLKEVMLDGYFHADPHPGNLLVLPGGVIGVHRLWHDGAPG